MRWRRQPGIIWFVVQYAISSFLCALKLNVSVLCVCGIERICVHPREECEPNQTKFNQFYKQKFAQHNHTANPLKIYLHGIHK